MVALIELKYCIHYIKFHIILMDIVQIKTLTLLVQSTPMCTMTLRWAEYWRWQCAQQAP